jgi:hypothetical protein
MNLAPLPDLRDPKFKFDDISAEMDNLISERAAEVVKQSPQMEQINAITNIGQGQQQGNPLQLAQQLAQLEAQMLQMKTQQELQIEEAKAKQDMAIKDAETKQELAIQQAELNQDLQAKMAKLQLELQIIRDKYQAKKGG